MRTETHEQGTGLMNGQASREFCNIRTQGQNVAKVAPDSAALGAGRQPQDSAESPALTRFAADASNQPDAPQQPPDARLLKQPGRSGIAKAAATKVAKAEQRQAEGREALRQEAYPAKKIGRPSVLTDYVKAQLVANMALGLSLRQAAAHCGVSAASISRALKDDSDLAEELEASRQRSQLHPLLVVVQESRTNWRAATWLLKYLSRQGSVLPNNVDEEAEVWARTFEAMRKGTDPNYFKTAEAKGK